MDGLIDSMKDGWIDILMDGWTEALMDARVAWLSTENGWDEAL